MFYIRSRLPILLMGFSSGTCFLTFLKISFAVWLVSDFVSTPFALKPQLGISPLPLLATYVRLMMMSRLKNMFYFTARFLRWFLSAGSTRSYFSQTGFSAFLRQENNKKLHEPILLYEQASSHTSHLKACSCKPCSQCNHHPLFVCLLCFWDGSNHDNI
jgi:hypothetical protein